MKFSILLPTLNRLELLKYAIKSVTSQSYQNWEIIVSDNCSEQDIAGYCHRLNDERIRYVRTSKRIPVTANWNNALLASTGDYVLMLGDDDAILPGYFNWHLNLIKKYNDPDFIFSSALTYAWPGVLKDYPEGYLIEPDYHIFGDGSDVLVLDHENAKKITQASMNFNLQIAYNMQHSMVSRKLIDKLSEAGDFYQSPYPDYYATNAMFLVAENILINPFPSTVIGISKKSFGFYYFNSRETEGVDFLNNANQLTSGGEESSLKIPGSEHNWSWYLAMKRLEENYGDKYGVSVNYRNYRKIAIHAVYCGYWSNLDLDKKILSKIHSKLNLKEKIRIWFVHVCLGKIFFHIPMKNFVRRLLSPYLDRNAVPIRWSQKQYSNIEEVIEAFPIKHGKRLQGFVK